MSELQDKNVPQTNAPHTQVFDDIHFVAFVVEFKKWKLIKQVADPERPQGFDLFTIELPVCEDPDGELDSAWCEYRGSGYEKFLYRIRNLKNACRQRRLNDNGAEVTRTA